MERVPRDRRSLDILSVKKEAKLSASEMNNVQVGRGDARPEGILARWIESLAEFDYQIEHRPGRLHCNADGVSRPHVNNALER